MTDKSVWIVTGAGRGMGVDIVRAALTAGHAVEIFEKARELGAQASAHRELSPSLPHDDAS